MTRRYYEKIRNSAEQRSIGLINDESITNAELEYRSKYSSSIGVSMYISGMFSFIALSLAVFQTFFLAMLNAPVYIMSLHGNIFIILISALAIIFILNLILSRKISIQGLSYAIALEKRKQSKLHIIKSVVKKAPEKPGIRYFRRDGERVVWVTTYSQGYLYFNYR